MVHFFQTTPYISGGRYLTTEQGFLRIPNNLVEALLRTPLSGGQCRIVLWVVRQTLGWNRDTTPYTWYRVARDLAMDRGGVVRAGHALLQWGILCLDKAAIGLQEDVLRWRCPTVGKPGQKAMMPVSDDGCQRKAMPGVIESDDICRRNRCQESSLFRRAKDSSKDRLKTYKRQAPQSAATRRRLQNGAFSKQRHPAGAAKPIPGKYDRLS